MICWLRSLCPVSEYLNAWVCFQALFPDSSFTPMQTLEGNGSGSTNWKSVSHREDFTRVRGLLASIQVQPQMQVFGRVNQQMAVLSLCHSAFLFLFIFSCFHPITGHSSVSFAGSFLEPSILEFTKGQPLLTFSSLSTFSLYDIIGSPKYKISSTC